MAHHREEAKGEIVDPLLALAHCVYKSEYA
jgi:hypothetical protein